MNEDSHLEMDYEDRYNVTGREEECEYPDWVDEDEYDEYKDNMMKHDRNNYLERRYDEDDN